MITLALKALPNQTTNRNSSFEVEQTGFLE